MMSISNCDFVHWHCHSEYSSFDGLAKLDSLVTYARKLGFPALAITDHGNIGSFVKFIQKCNASKDKSGKEIPYSPLKPILGCEFYLAAKHDWKSKDKAAENGGYQKDGRRGNRHLNLYAMNWKGYQNLAALSELSWTKGFYHNPRIDIELLEKHSEGLMCGSACLSSVVNANLLYDRYDKAKEAAGWLKEMFKDNFFLEVMYHGISSEAQIIPDILKLSADLKIPVLATNDCHYIEKHHSKSQEVLMCMSTSSCLTNPKHIHLPYQEFYMKSAEEMQKMFRHVPFVLSNTVALAERINSKDIEKNLFGGMRLPKFELPEGFEEPYDYLVHLAKQGMKRLGWEKSQPHLQALKKELIDVKVAKDNNNYDFATYFLIVWDYVNHAKKKDIVVGCGRGSGAASVLLRCLGITYGPDPLSYGLIWERFLGFDEMRFVMDKDFGIESDETETSIIESDDLDEEREVEEDFGGVDRY